jgi:gamma-glutamylcyclotransferase (GGCT)/AIG2-like uncharacterized protein YtfP
MQPDRACGLSGTRRVSRGTMTDLVFFYGTLMAAFERPGRVLLERLLTPVGTGCIRAALFDLGFYPAAVPAEDWQVWGEVHRMADAEAVLSVLDEIEGYSAAEPDASLYTRSEFPVTLENGRSVEAWVYFYNAPLGKAERIESGDYLRHLKVR